MGGWVRRVPSSGRQVLPFGKTARTCDLWFNRLCAKGPIVVAGVNLDRSDWD